MGPDFEYDVALSFAGENRTYVETVAELLRSQGVRVFLDTFEKSKLWGKDLARHLDEVYRKKARFCVVFISKYYPGKTWPRHEFSSVLARALQEKTEYMLPARFDDTDVAGLQPTISYIDLRNTTPEELASLILEKLGSPVVVKQGPAQSMRRPRIAKSFSPYEEAKEWIQFLTGEIKKRCLESEADGVSCSIFERGGTTCLRVLVNGRTAYSLNVQMGGMLGDKGLSFYGIASEIRHDSGSSNAFGSLEWSKEHEQVVLKLHDLSLLDVLPGRERLFTRQEFLGAIWEQICKAIEQGADQTELRSEK